MRYIIVIATIVGVMFTSSSYSTMSSPSMQSCMHMMSHNLGPSDANYDKRFIDMMIPHHEGAVEMAKDALKKSNRPEIRQLAKNIITTQEQEIAQMKKWRKEWYGQ